MYSLKKFLAATAATLCCLSSALAQETEPAAPCQWGLGWVFANQFDSHIDGISGETAWGNPMATQATFDGVKEAGFETVLLPVTWMGHFGEAPDYKIDEDWMSRVEEVVGYCEKAGLKVIINLHHDGASSQYWLNIKDAVLSSDRYIEITENLTQLWRQIALRFRDKGQWLSFEVLNDIQDGGWGWGENRTDGGKQYKILNSWNQACVDAIRSTGGENATRWISCPGYSANTELTLKYMTVPTDPANHVAVVVHCYEPYLFTLDAVQDNYTEADMDYLESLFMQLKEEYLDNGIQCYIGGFCCAQRANESKEENRLSYLNKFAQMAKEYGLSIMLWDNNIDNNGKGGKESNAFIDHATGQYKSDKGKAAIEAIMNGYK